MNNWYFGTGIGLDFNQIPPRPFFNNLANSQEGCASVSDNNGNLLFYTNGLVLINRKHDIMLNGNGLRGDLSSTNNTLIIPLPGNDSIFYVFTVGATTQLNKGLRYNIVNINGDNGFGEVIEKNTFVEEAYEKIAAVRHCNNKDVWIIIRKWESDEYNAYLLTSTGLNISPVISKTGLIVGGIPNNAIGTLKSSIDGKKLVAIHSTENDLVELMSFDNVTGIISNPLTFKPNTIPHPLSFTGVYGAEFSPNSNLLYVSSNNSAAEPCILYQFDITSNNAATIMASKQTIAQVNPWFAGALQTGPDNKIYLAMWKDTALSVIENPDVFGPGCNFQLNKISFGSRGEPVQFGLPSVIQTDLNLSQIPFDFTRTGKCTDKNLQFIINRTNGIDSVKWDFGDGQQSNLISPTHLYNNSGFFSVSLVVYKIDCSGLFDTIRKNIWIADSVNLLGNDIKACSFENLQLSANLNVPGVNYLWNTGSTSDKINVSAPGLYWVKAEYKGCINADSININVIPKPVINIGNDTTICFNQGIILTAGNTPGANYLWNTGETSASIKVNSPGKYSIIVTENTCSAFDTLNVVWGDCPFFIPNAFTPNKDGVNDNFGVLNGFTFQNFTLNIYNRYGKVIFSSKNISEKWDGTYKGKAMPTGAYPWSIIYINGQGYTKWLKGTVLLLH